MTIQKNGSKVDFQELEILKEYCTNQSENNLCPSARPLKEHFYKHLDHLEFFQRKIIIILKRNELSESLIDILSDFLC